MSDALTDVATATAIGRRSRQEDAVLAHFTDGEDTGFAVLSDGMGGHEDGDLASRVIVSEIFGSISLSGRTEAAEASPLRERLQMAVLLANKALRKQIDAGQGQEGMGGTVITTVLKEDRLSWISIGDSALYLFRDDRLKRLNEIHSLAPQIDLLLHRGEIDAETASNHPQRNCLTSALVGAGINLIDCPPEPFVLRQGDVIMMASDGLEVLGPDQISDIVQHNRAGTSQQISQALMEAVEDQKDPDQDNVSLIVIKPQLPGENWAHSPVAPHPFAVFLAAVQRRVADLRQNLAGVLGGRSAL